MTNCKDSTKKEERNYAYMLFAASEMLMHGSLQVWIFSCGLLLYRDMKSIQEQGKDSN